MDNKSNAYSGNEKIQQTSQFSKNGVYVREDDKDWGSAGMNNIEEETNQTQ